VVAAADVGGDVVAADVMVGVDVAGDVVAADVSDVESSLEHAASRTPIATNPAQTDRREAIRTTTASPFSAARI
jgi:hypothetical protein